MNEYKSGTHELTKKRQDFIPGNRIFCVQNIYSKYPLFIQIAEFYCIPECI